MYQSRAYLLSHRGLDVVIKEGRYLLLLDQSKYSVSRNLLF